MLLKGMGNGREKVSSMTYNVEALVLGDIVTTALLSLSTLQISHASAPWYLMRLCFPRVL